MILIGVGTILQMFSYTAVHDQSSTFYMRCISRHRIPAVTVKKQYAPVLHNVYILCCTYSLMRTTAISTAAERHVKSSPWQIYSARLHLSREIPGPSDAAASPLFTGTAAAVTPSVRQLF